MKRIQTRVSKDLTKYTENFFFGMSLRQTLLSAAGVCVTTLSYIFLMVPGIAAVGLGLPFFAFAFLRPDGLPASQWLRCWARAVLIRPKIRVHAPENELYEFLWHGRLCGRRVLTTKELRVLRAPALWDKERSEEPEPERERHEKKKSVR